jgi:hypothetical protein
VRRFVITGTGRCGTQWCARVLKAAGANVTWEHTFDAPQMLGAPWAWGEAIGEVSFRAVPRLPELRAEGTLVVVVIREPLACARSWLRIGQFQNARGISVSLRYLCPWVLAQPTPAARAVAYWVAWNRAALPNADEVLRTEQLDEKELCKLVGLRCRPARPVPRFDTVREHVAASLPDGIQLPADADVTWESIPAWLADEAQALHERVLSLNSR